MRRRRQLLALTLVPLVACAGLAMLLLLAPGTVPSIVAVAGLGGDDDSGSLPLAQRPPLPAERPDQAKAPELPDSVEFEFQTSDGKPAAGLKLVLSSLAAENEDLATDDRGRLLLAGNQRIGTRFTLVDDTLFFQPIPRRLERTYAPPDAGDSRKITVYGLRSYDVVVRYEDGSPWEGDLWFFSAERAPCRHIDVTNGAAAGLQVVSGSIASASAASARNGFSNARAVWTGEADPREPVVLTLARSEGSPLSVVVLDLTCYSRGEEVTVVFSEILAGDAGVATRTELKSKVLLGGAIHPIGPYDAGKYAVSVMTHTQGWNSGDFQLNGSETLTLKPDLQPCGSVAARIVAANGDVIPDARLIIQRGTYPRWRSWLNEPAGWSADGVRAAVDKRGNCELYGVPPGDVEIEICARTHESYFTNCRLEPGQRLDLGEIQLQPAQGAIQVQLINVDANQAYEAILYQTGGASVDQPVAFGADGLVDIQLVPLRSYTIMILAKGGGSLVSRRVDLSPANPTARLDVDLAAPPG